MKDWFPGPKVHKLDVLSSWWCTLLLKRKRGQVCPTRKVIEEDRDSLGENMSWDHNGQINLRAIQKFKILSATHSYMSIVV